MNQALLEWYQSHGRALPWRLTTDPYAIWVSEIMLQQTQVATVLPYYERWMTRFPTAKALADATDQEALSLWQGLGYYRRCRNMLLGVRQVAERGWPQSRQEWLKVSGVGDYTASALASIALGEVTAVVDGNVERVFARMEESALTADARRRAASMWANALIDGEHPADWNQAIMELGATVCRPARPQCHACPVTLWCKAFQNQSTDQFPVANPRPARVDLDWPLSVPCDGERVGISPLVERWWQGMSGFAVPVEHPDGPPLFTLGHTVTHHRLRFLVWTTAALPDGAEWVGLDGLEHVPLPAPMRKIAVRVLGTPFGADETS